MSAETSGGRPIDQGGEDYIDPMVSLESDQSQQEQEDAEIRFEDAEILGKSFPVRRSIMAVSHNVIRAKESTFARVRNTFAKPGELHGKAMHNLAQAKFERKKAKFEAVEGKSARLVARRAKAMNKAEERMNYRANISNTRTQRMENRRTAVVENHDTRRHDTLNYYKDKKQEAYARKTLRRQLKSEGAGFVERRQLTKETMADVPREHLLRLGELAISAKLTAAQVEKSEDTESKYEKSATKTERQMAAANSRLESYKSEAKRAEATADKMENIYLPKAEARVDELQLELNGMEPDDPALRFVQQDLQEAKDKVDRLVMRDIPYWQGEAEKNRTKESQAEHLIEQLSDEIAQQERQREAAASGTEKLQTTRQLYESRVYASADELLDVPEAQPIKPIQEDSQNGPTKQAAA